MCVCVCVQFPKVILERASYPPVTHRKMNKIQNKQNVAKRKRCQTTN